MSEPPVARVDPAPRWTPIWLVPIVALAVALFLGWQAWGARGTTITIAFPEGFGLKAGDTLRHRGIVAGEVSQVAYTAELDGVTVDLVLDQGAIDLARVGSRFWVVRPSFGWAGITGLETLIGDRYLAVLPGDGPAQRHFVGLDQPPIAEALQPGLDITLEGEARGSLSPGSPVTFRRIQVGSVLAISLASDGRSVQVSARVRQEYAALVQPGTKFWETSGLGLDVGITGASFHLESLESLVRGGVSLATPAGPGERVSTGHRFTLHDRPEPAWLDWRPSVPIGHSQLPVGSPVPHPRRASLSWTEGRLWDDTEVREGWVLAVPGALLCPADLLEIPEDAHEGSVSLELGGVRISLDAQGPEVQTPQAGLGLVSLPEGLDVEPWPRSMQRVPENGPEDCVLVLDPGSPPLSLAPGGFEATDDGWLIDGSLPVDQRWHGAPALARVDGRLVGVVLVDSSGARVIPLQRPLP